MLLSSEVIFSIVIALEKFAKVTRLDDIIVFLVVSV